MDRNAHVINHGDDVFDLLGIDDLVWQMIIDFAIGEEALFLPAGDQKL